MIEAYISLGSNLNSPIAQLNQAILSIREQDETNIISCSSFYQTKAWGKVDQPDFINAVVKLETTLTAGEVLSFLLEIENAQGRQRLEQWGARTLDCDLLLYGNAIIEEDNLSVPHPRMKSRGFVLVPLFEIAPNLVLPTGEKVIDLLETCDCTGIQKIC